MLVRRTKPRAEFLDQRGSGCLVADVTRPLLAGRESLANVVHQRREAHGRVPGHLRGQLEYLHRVQTGVDLRMPLLRLRYAVECGDLREHDLERAACAQYLEVDRGLLLAERALRLDPDALGHQRGKFAARRDAAHELESLRRHRETEPGEA